MCYTRPATGGCSTTRTTAALHKRPCPRCPASSISGRAARTAASPPTPPASGAGAPRRAPPPTRAPTPHPAAHDSTATAPASVCDGATWPSTAPYAFSNPFQTVALFRNRESVWRSIVSGRGSWDAVATPVHTLRFLATGGGDIFTQKNAVFSPPELQFEQLAGLPGSSVIGFAQSQSFNVNGNIVHQYKAGAGTATSQVGVQFESSDLDRANTLN